VSAFYAAQYKIENISIVKALQLEDARRRTVFFTALHVMQMRYSDENSVRLSHACIVTKRRKICPDLYTIQKII